MQDQTGRKSRLNTFLKSVLIDTISYSTVRSATVTSKGVVIVYRLSQLAVLAYIIGYKINFCFYL